MKQKLGIVKIDPDLGHGATASIYVTQDLRLAVTAKWRSFDSVLAVELRAVTLLTEKVARHYARNKVD